MRGRRGLALPALFVVIALITAACGSASRPELTNATEILTGAVTAMQKATAVHLDIKADGTVSADLTGTGSAGNLSIAGTTVTGDADLKNGDAHVSMAVPALLGLTAEVIVVGSDTFTKVSLTGTKYTRSATSVAGPSDPAAMLKSVTDFLARPDVTPVKKDDAACGSRSCYQVTINLSPTELNGLLPSAIPSLGLGFGGATVAITMLIEKDTLYPASATVQLSGPKIGNVTITINLSNWDKAVSISPPPADQIQ